MMEKTINRLSLHDRQRDTGYWLTRTPENAAKLLKALEAFGFGGLGLVGEDFTTPQHVVQLGYPPFRIDLLTDINGVAFETAWPHRETVVHDGLPLHFIGLEDLKANKRASGRPRDLDDLENLP